MIIRQIGNSPRLRAPRSWSIALGAVALILAPLVIAAAKDEGGTERVRLKEPRIKPLEKSEWNDAQRALLEPRERNGRIINIFKTLAKHPDLFEDWIVFGGHVLGGSTLPAREREILILRVGWLCRAEYEWAQHAVIGKRAGLSDEEIVRLTKGPDAKGWSDFDAALLRAADELHSDAFVTDATWKTLAERYDEKQMMDLVFTVGQYNLVSMALNSLGVQVDEGLEGFPKE